MANMSWNASKPVLATEKPFSHNLIFRPIWRYHLKFFIRNRCVYMSLDKCVACDRHLDVSQLQLSFITAILATTLIANLWSRWASPRKL